DQPRPARRRARQGEWHRARPVVAADRPLLPFGLRRSHRRPGDRGSGQPGRGGSVRRGGDNHSDAAGSALGRSPRAAVGRGAQSVGGRVMNPSMAGSQLRTAEELRMYEALRDSAPRYANPFLEQLPRARKVVLHRLISALWREDIGAIRTASRRLDTVTPVSGQPDSLERSVNEVRMGVWLIHELSATVVLAFPIRAEHAFDNLKPDHPLLCSRGRDLVAIQTPHELVELLAEHAPAPGWRSFAAELADT